MSDDKKVIFSMVKVNKTTPTGKHILKDIYLSFFYGAKIGIIGNNGAGKSTVMKIIAGLDDAYQGEVVWSDGYTVGYLSQEPQLDESKTVRQIVEEGTQEIVDVLKEYEEMKKELEVETKRRKQLEQEYSKFIQLKNKLISEFAGETECFPCRTGTQGLSGAVSCEGCVAGKAYNPEVKSCQLCPEGRFSPGHRIDADGECYLCPEGYIDRSLRDRCEACPPGFFSVQLGASSSCSACSAGKYQPHFGRASAHDCHECHPGSTSKIGEGQ